MTSQILMTTVSSLCFASAVFLLIHFVTPLWDRFTSMQMGKLSSRYRQLGCSEIYLQISLRVWTILLVVLFVVFGVVLNMVPVAIALVAIVYVAPWRILDLLILRRERVFRKQLTTAASGLANARLAGLSLQQCMRRVASESSRPLRSELERIVSDNRNGRTLEQALADRREQLDLNAFTLLSLTIETARQEGGNIAACLVSLGKSFQEEERLQAKIECDTAAGRQTILLLSLFPPIFMGIGFLILPEGTRLLFTTFAGNCVLAAIAGLIYVGYGWAISILKVEV